MTGLRDRLLRRVPVLRGAGAVALVLCLSACAPGGASSPPVSESPSTALRLVPVIWRVRDAAGESADTWIRFDSDIEVIRPKGDVGLSWSTQGDALLTNVESWSMTLGSRPPTVPWLTSTTTFTRDGDGWVLTDADGRRTARLVRDGVPPASANALHSVPKVDGTVRAQHADAVPGSGVRAIDPVVAIGTWGLPGARAADGSITLSSHGRWSARTSCEVLGEAVGGGGAFRVLPNGLLLVTEGAVAGVGCTTPQPAPPHDARAILRFGTTASVAIDGSRMTVYDRAGERLGTLDRKR